MNIDLQRLHDVIDGKRTGRGCGKTFARCVQAMQYVDSGIERVYFFISYGNDFDHTFRMMYDIFTTYGKSCVANPKNKEIRCDNSVIRFLVHADGPHRNNEIMAGASGLIIKDLRL